MPKKKMSNAKKARAVRDIAARHTRYTTVDSELLGAISGGKKDYFDVDQAKKTYKALKKVK